MTVVDDKPAFWLASKQSEVLVAKKSEAVTGVKKGEPVIKIIWFDNINGFKYSRMNDLVHVSVSSVLVTRSKIIPLST